VTGRHAQSEAMKPPTPATPDLHTSHRRDRLARPRLAFVPAAAPVRLPRRLRTARSIGLLSKEAFDWIELVNRGNVGASEEEFLAWLASSTQVPRNEVCGTDGHAYTAPTADAASTPAPPVASFDTTCAPSSTH
jgi:hypothetical protein